MTATTSTSAPPEPARYPEVDVLKAVCIVAVVLIHSTRSFWDPSQSIIEYWLKHILRFAVPGFLVASGFLYATRERVPLKLSLGRLRRILFPYLVASICAELFWAFRGSPRDPSTIGFNLAVANSFGQYYYVFVLVPLVLATPLFARIPIRILWVLFLAGVVLQGLFETRYIGSFDPIWRVRNPIMWWPYFVMGWLARLHHQRMRAWAIEHRPVAAFSLWVCLLAFWWLPDTTQVPEITALRYLALWLGVYGAIAMIYIVSCGREVQSAVRWLSEATYAIYLFHLFFVVPGVELIRPEFGAFESLTIASIWCLGIVGSLAIILVARAVLGERSRDIVGA